MAKRTKTADGDSTPAQPTYLLITEDRSAGWGSGHYFHLYGRIVTAKYENGQRLPWGTDDTYGDGYLYAGLRVSCQGDERSQIREVEPVYGISVEYHESSRLELRQLRRMVKTLEYLDRRLEKMSETRGYVRTFGEYCGRVAEAFGCEGIAIEKTKRTQEITGYRYAWLTIGEGVNGVTNRIWQWQREADDRRQAAAESEAAS